MIDDGGEHDNEDDDDGDGDGDVEETIMTKLRRMMLN